MRLHAALLVAVGLAACEGAPPPDREFRFCETPNLERARWIIECASAANPKSDEEGEDLVAQCEKTSEAVFCPYVMHRFDGQNWRPVRATHNGS